MGILDKLRKNNVAYNIQTPTSSLTREPTALDAANRESNREHQDFLPSFQTNLVRQIEYSNPSTRWLHTKANPYAHKHTYAFVDAVFYHQPFCFQYVGDDEEDLLKAKPIPTMKAYHKLWNQYNLFNWFKEVQSQGLGVGASWLVRIAPKTFVVFNTAHIDGDNYWRDPKTHQITEIWFNWKGSNGGYIKGSTIQNGQESIVKAKIGSNAVEFIPIPDSDSPFGRSELLHIWTTLTYRELNMYYATLYNKKGGVTGRVVIAPDAMDSTSRRILKKEALKGVESELIELYYPQGSTDASKGVTYAENKGGTMNFGGVNDMLATNSTLPPSFVQGPASGALGGQAPVEDAKTINRCLMSYSGRVQQLVKDINQTFFGLYDHPYLIVPYLRDESSPIKESNNPFNKDKKEEDKPAEKDATKSENNSRTTTLNIKFHKKPHVHGQDENAIIYEGNLWQSGVYQYESFFDEEPIFEYLSGKELSKFIDDPMAVKEAYLSIEHPFEVTKENAIGKLIIKGWKKEADGSIKDITELYFKNEWNPNQDNIFLSPVYFAGIVDKGTKYKGKNILDQVDISLVNAGLVLFPRSSLTGLDSSAHKSI